MLHCQKRLAEEHQCEQSYITDRGDLRKVIDVLDGHLQPDRCPVHLIVEAVQ